MDLIKKEIYCYVFKLNIRIKCFVLDKKIFFVFFNHSLCKYVKESNNIPIDYAFYRTLI